jgi:hypothetical protein
MDDTDRSRSVSGWAVSEPDRQLPPSPSSAGRGRTAGPAADGPGLSDLVRSLADDSRTLLRQEVHLAKAEVVRAARQLAVDSALLAVGAAVSAVGGLCLVVALALGLGALLGSYWLGTLITGFLLLLVGAGFLWKGARNLRTRELVPTRTAESLREDARWARQEAKELREGLS